MSRQVVSTNNAPAALGPYSQAIVSDVFVFVSGQIPINPASGQIESEDIVGQTKQVLKNLEAILIASGSSIANVVKTTCFLNDINEWPAMNDVYGKVFHTDPPARSAFEVGKLPKDAKIEIEAIARLNSKSSA
ncbi:putative endoribonuclease L-PSP [Coemansia reversa NRRL 1564]|uniref:Putative endoribonuclease L-PSP n=1 Tax=Coemansia reversa (strain ATCC 12441 / NRRL 1564) TaxID=763665 RepID=A0A2G5BJJ2_COERN|nr:putative endoribonuclease L-PSP [Coemansia reversa NRRL 1564]|eukprot:PIA19169.1 putative endoribonuclease L-PSP [Coemansia reversa NRRL 1564]